MASEAVEAERPRNKHLSRWIYGPILAAVLIGALWLDHKQEMHLLLWAVCGAFASVGLLEFYKMCSRIGHRPAAVAGITVLVLAFVGRLLVDGPLFWRIRDFDLVAAQTWVDFFYPLLPAALVAWVLIKLVVCARTFSAVDAVLTLGGAAYVGLLLVLPDVWDFRGPAWLPANPWILVFLLVTNKGSDVFAYVVGSLVGRHKMIPSVSPGKTWEGAIGGLVVGTAGGALCLAGPTGAAILDPLLIAFSAAITIAAQMGDLVESAIKRWAGAKDSGSLLPGLGGALDVLDSFLLSIPATYLFLKMACFFGW